VLAVIISVEPGAANQVKIRESRLGLRRTHKARKYFLGDLCIFAGLDFRAKVQRRQDWLVNFSNQSLAHPKIRQVF
jgi:hypothetical protein